MNPIGFGLVTCSSPLEFGRVTCSVDGMRSGVWGIPAVDESSLVLRNRHLFIK